MLQAVHSLFSATPLTLYRLAKTQLGWLVAVLPLGVLVYLVARAAGPVMDGDSVTAAYSWVPSLDVDLVFRMDGLSLVFAMLITGIGALVCIYASAYLHRDSGRFYLYLMIFMASMLGVVLADNLVLLFMFWELTSFSSYLLIAFYNEKENAREAARQALIVTAAGGFAMLPGLLLLGMTAGTWQISHLAAARETVVADKLYLPVLILIAVGAFTKSAQFPFHYWLPDAMEAPTPVSAYLHSATMVNAGIYLLARLYPVLGQTQEWQWLIGSAGGITLLLGGYLAWQQTDLKRILAYTTVGMLGTMTLLLGIGSSRAVEAVLVLVCAHALYKGALFMVVGAIDHATGTRDITYLGGLRRSMPTTALAALLAALSMAGIPPLLGFITKDLIYETALALHGTAIPAVLILVAGNLFNVTAAGLVAVRPFYGVTASPRKHVHEVPLSMWLGPLVLGGLGLIGGLFAAALYQPLLVQMFNAVYHKPYTIELSLWHGLSTALALSGVTLASGSLLYYYADTLRPRLAGVSAMGDRLGPARLYTLTIQGTLSLASTGTQALLKAYLRQYIRVILITLVLASSYVFATQIEFDNLLHSSGVRFYELVIAGVIVAAALMSTQINKRLSAAAALGTVGYGVTLIYILYGAPDLAMTQFAIETLTVILFVVTIYRLPKLKKLSSTRSRRMDAVLAALVGSTMTLITLVVISVPLQSRLSPYFAENSYVKAHGHNVVNVILVDFRGFDTMGEITVLSVAAIGVFALLSLNLHRYQVVHSGEDA
jgi:multicomponent Na+:H+ antiporter subunit A